MSTIQGLLVKNQESGKMGLDRVRVVPERLTIKMTVYCMRAGYEPFTNVDGSVSYYRGNELLTARNMLQLLSH